MRLILFTAPDTPVHELRLLDRCFQSGLKHLHVRKPGWPVERLREYVAQIDVEQRRKVVLHSHHQLSEEFEVGVRST